MTTNGTPRLDARDARLLRLAAHAVDEAEAVLALLPAAQEVQFDRSVSRLPAEQDAGRRAVGGHSDPTADVATDPGRLYLREVLSRCEAHLVNAATSLGGVRRGLERALVPYDGPDSEG